MDLSNFVEKAKELNVLGFKVSQNGELIGARVPEKHLLGDEKLYLLRRGFCGPGRAPFTG